MFNRFSKKTAVRFAVAAALSAAFSFSALAADIGPGYTGWNQFAPGSWEYYEKGTKVKNDFREIDGVGYQFDAEGVMIAEGVTAASTAGTEKTETASAEAAASDLPVDPANLIEGYSQRENTTGYPDVVEVVISQQHVYCYRNNVLHWDSYCVTGCTADGHNTPEGVFKIQSKETGRYLQGPKNAKGVPAWKNWVDFWMPFHDGCGLHDASWRNKFAGTIYQYAGSHGCVNLPCSRVPALFNLVYVGMPVYVHQ